MALLMRPGYTLLLAGIVAYVLSRFVGAVPLVGSMVAVMLFLFAVFGVIGGLWLIVAERRAARA